MWDIGVRHELGRLPRPAHSPAYHPLFCASGAWSAFLPEIHSNPGHVKRFQAMTRRRAAEIPQPTPVGWLSGAATATADPESNRAWTASLGTYLALSGALAVVAGLAPPGATRTAGRGVAVGAAVAFVLAAVIPVAGLFLVYNR